MRSFDCEQLGSGWPAQPVNTWSSLAFIAAGWWLWRRGHRLPAVLLGLVGAGSWMFHGSPGGAASWVHDVSLYALVAVAAVETWRRLAARRPPALAASVFVAGIGVWFTGRSAGLLCDPASLLQPHAVWHGLAALAVVLLYGTPRSTGD